MFLERPYWYFIPFRFPLAAFAVIPYRPTKMTVPRSLSFSSHTIASSPSFQSVFNAALDEYAEHTGNDLTNHPLSIQVESCRSPGEVFGVLQEQAKDFREFREGNKKLMKVIEPTVNVLCSLSGAFSDNIGLVRHECSEMACPGCPLTSRCHRHTHQHQQFSAVLLSSFWSASPFTSLILVS